MNFDLLKEHEPSLELIKGDGLHIKCDSISTPSEPKENTFVFIKNQKFLSALLEKAPFKKLGVIAPSEFVSSLNDKLLKSLVEAVDWLAKVDSVDRAMCSLSKPFYDEKFSELNMHVDGRQMGSASIDPDAEIAQNVFIGEDVIIEKNVTIMPGCVVMAKSHIGEGTILFPNVTIYPYTRIGNDCRIHSQVIIGADGFGYNFLDGEHKKIWHFGGVEIRNNVEIGAGSCVDAGSFTPTFIDDGTKLDNQVQVAHNNKIGKHCILCGRTGLAGSVTLEDYVVIGAGGGCAPGAVLKKGTQLAAMAVVSENAIWGPGETLAGHPARPLKEWLKNQARLRILANKK